MIGVPLRSSQLVIDKTGALRYAKDKVPFRDYFVLWDAGLKVNFRLNRWLLLYLKQGYSFKTGNIYANDYPLKLSLSNLYGVFGISLVLF